MKLSDACLLVCIAATAAALTGCAGLDNQRKLLAESPSCCASYTALPALDLPAEDVTMEIEERDPVFEFPLGKSRFKAFRLPADLPENAELYVRSMVPLTTVFADGRTWSPYFHAAVSFIDVRGELISTVYDTQPSAWCGGGSCSGVVTQPRIPKGARMAIIHTPLARVGQFRFDAQNHPDQTYMIGGAFVSVPGGAGQRRSVAFATGRLQVGLRGSQP